jgi:HlyD family secretion protein
MNAPSPGSAAGTPGLAAGTGALDFSPAILRLQRQPPSPLPRLVLYLIAGLFAGLLIWSLVGRLDIIAVAPGRLVPSSYVKVVQPADAGIIKEILVREGDLVRKDQILVRMDASLTQADSRQVQTQLQTAGMQLRRIDAELAGTEPASEPQDDPTLFQQMLAQYRARRQAQADALATERAMYARVEQDLRGAQEQEAKLAKMLPIYEDQERSWRQLVDEGFAGRLQAEERKRLRIDAEQELKARRAAMEGYRATLQQSRQRLAQIESTYRQQLYNERVELEAQHQRLLQEWEKQLHRNELLELKAPQDGIIKDLATHTEGAVLQPGTVLMTIVPADEPLRAEVWVDNRDRGFVREGQPVKVKIAPYPFQKYGMVDGVVRTVSADATEAPQRGAGAADAGNGAGQTAAYQFRSIVELKSQALESDGIRHKLMPGMQVDAEISLGDRSVMEYLLSPVRKAFHEAGRER